MEYPIFRGNLIILSNGDKNMDQIKTGNFLVSLRKEKNITQQQLADILQVSVRPYPNGSVAKVILLFKA